MNEFQKSVRAILYERIVSPLSGTFFLSWIIWNWQLIYYLIIFDGNQSVIDKISYIENNYNDWKVLILYPLLSCIFLILVYPFLSTGAYWIYLKFKEWQNEIKNSIEKNRLLTVEQSVQLKIEIKKQQDRFLELEKNKESEIVLLKTEKEELLKKISELENSNTESPAQYKDEILTQKEDEDMQDFIKGENAKYFDTISQYISNGWQFDSDAIPQRVMSGFLAFELIEKSGSKGYFEFTSKGRKYLREYLKMLNKN